MKSITLAIKYFGLAYLIGTILGFITFYIHLTLMWITLFTVMPVVFGYFFYTYLKKVNCTPEESLRESIVLVFFWIITSFILDGIVYIAIIPLVLSVPPNWTFFIDQSPWIWMNYATIFLLGYFSRWYFVRQVSNKPNVAL